MPRRKKAMKISLLGKKIDLPKKLFNNILFVFFVLLFIVTGVSLASYFSPSLQGFFTLFIRQLLFFKFSGFAFFVPFIFLLIATHFLSNEKFRVVKWNITSGFILIFISLIGLNQAGDYGRFLFENIAYAFSSAGAYSIFLVSFFFGLVLFFDLSFTDIVLGFVKFINLVKKLYLGFKNVLANTKTELSKIEEIKKETIEEKPQEQSKEKDIKINAGTEVFANTSKSEIKQETKPDQHLIKPFPAADLQSSYVFPPLSLLEDIQQKAAERGDVKKNAQTIEETLSSFGIRASVVEINYGPAVTQYALKIPLGTKLSKITTLANDLALNLAAPKGQVRIEAPIPGRSLVGIELPNIRPQIVTLRDVLSSPVLQKETDPTTVPLGLDVGGELKFYSISRMPHVLIAGATGSGKSVLLNAWICSFLMRTRPDELKMIMVDPKRVELTLYNGIPHLLTDVIVEPDQTVSALRWTVKEMNNRYKEFADLGVRNIQDYNELPNVEKKPYIIFIIDELADLMMYAAKDVEELITRLAQMARAVGIHLVLATQRPSVDVITGLMKANIPTRIAFNVSSMVDSRVILDGPGAEKLLGKGDMLFLPPDQSKPNRIQGPYISGSEIKKIIEFLKSHNLETEYDKEIIQGSTEYIQTSKKSNSISLEGKDVLFDKALSLIIGQKTASASLLQRYLSIGYARAARILDQLEKAGYVGPAEGSKPRKVLKRQIDQSN